MKVICVSIIALFFIQPAFQLLGKPEDNAYNILVSQNYEEAIIAYETLINDQPDNPDYHFNLGVAYYETLRYASAQASFERALKYKIDDPLFQAQAEYNIGIALYNQAKLFFEENQERSIIYLKEAINTFRNANALKENFEAARYNLAVCKSLLEKIESMEKSPTDDDLEKNKQEENKESEDQKGEPSEQSTENSQSEPKKQSDQQRGAGSDSRGTESNKNQSPENFGSNQLGENMSLEEAILLIDSVEMDEKRIDLSTLKKSKRDDNNTRNLQINW